MLIPFFFQIILALLHNECMRQAEQAAMQESRSKNVIGHANWFSTLASTSVLSLSAYLRTGQLPYKSEFENELGKLENELTTLKQIAQSSPDQADNCRELTLSTDKLASMLRRIEQEHAGSAPFQKDDSASLDSPEFVSAFSAVFKDRSKLLATETSHQQLDSLQLAGEHRQQTERFIMFAIVLDVLAALFLISAFSKNIAARLRVLSDNTIRFANKQPLHALMSGEDEISQLDHMFHHVAEALDATSKRERAILEHAAEVICSFDHRGRITEINAACRAAWGYEPSELLGRNYLELVPANHQQAVLSSLQSGAKSKERFSFESRMSRKDGAGLFVRWSACWSNDEQSYFCVAHDITHEKYVEQLKSQFISTISHDLRTPITAISSCLELMLSGRLGRLTAPCTAMAVQAQRTIRRLIKLTDDLLVIERIESGALPLEVAAVDMKIVIQEAIASIKPLADEVNITIDDNAVGSEQVELDAGRITQVIVNLLSNAVKFTPPKGCIKVRTASANGWLEVSVIDPGRGIPEHAQTMLFDRYKQVELRDSKKGTGLGLAICKQIIEQHGGLTGVESKMGTGSRFWFRIPCKPTAEQPVAPQQSSFYTVCPGFDRSST